MAGRRGDASRLGMRSRSAPPPLPPSSPLPRHPLRSCRWTPERLAAALHEHDDDLAAILDDESLRCDHEGWDDGAGERTPECVARASKLAEKYARLAIDAATDEGVLTLPEPERTNIGTGRITADRQADPVIVDAATDGEGAPDG
jgi:hypothetical protein